MALLQVILIHLFVVGTLGELSEERRKRINDGIDKILTDLDTGDPGIAVSQDTRPLAAVLIGIKWLHYFKPGPEYFEYNIKKEKFTYENLPQELERLAKKMESANPGVVNNYDETVICFADSMDILKKKNSYDPEIVQAMEEMLLQSYISEQGLKVKTGDTLVVKGGMFLGIKNPSLSKADKEKKLNRTFKVPPLNTLTILGKNQS